jgi:hypothetical protein
VNSVVLEPAAQELVESTANHPFLFELGPDEGRTTLDDLQAGDVAQLAVDDEWTTVAGGPGWVFGDAHTHDRLVRELAVGAGAAVVLAGYQRSREVRYPVAIEQNYAVARWVASDGAGKGLDPSRIAVVGDSVGGNMTAALTLMAKERRGPKLGAQVLLYPVTDASFDTGSYEQFADGFYLRRDAMRPPRPRSPRRSSTSAGRSTRSARSSSRRADG